MLHLAARYGNEKAGLFLVKNGANCSAVNDRVRTYAYNVALFWEQFWPSDATVDSFVSKRH